MKSSHFAQFTVFFCGVFLAVAGCGAGSSGDARTTQQDELKAFLEENPEAQDIEMTP